MNVSMKNNPLVASINPADPNKFTSLLPSQINGVVNISKDLDFINQKLENVQKRLTFYDLYNISAIVSDPDTLNANITALLPNTSLIINSTTIPGYSRGDIIIKTNTGDLQVIKTTTGGSYYPSKITKDPNSPNYSITYRYSTTAPTINSSATINIKEEKELEEIKYSITFTNLDLANADEGVAYGNLIDLPRGAKSDQVINLIKRVGTQEILYPTIKVMNDIGEEIWCDLEVSVSNTTLTIVGNSLPYIPCKLLIK